MLDLLGHLAQRDLAQRRQVLDLEEVVQRRGHALARVDLALGRRSMSVSGVRSTSTTSSARREHAVGEGLAHAGAGQLGHLVVEALQVLHVHGGEDVDAGVEDVLDVLEALGVLGAGRVGVRQLVDQAELGCALEDRRQVHLLERAPRCVTRRRGSSSRPSPGRRSPRARAARGSRSPRRGPVGLRPGPPGACGRSCRPRRPCPGRSCSGSARRHFAQAPSRLWTTRSTSLMPMNGRDQAADAVDAACCAAAARWRRSGGSARRAGPAAPAAG